MVSSFAQTDCSKKINLTKLENSIISKVNELRVKFGIDTLSTDDSLKSISNVECQFLVNVAFATDPKFTENVSKVFGSKTYSSYHSNIRTKYNMKDFPIMDSYEDYIAESYVKQYLTDKMEHTILITKKYLNPTFVERIGITCIIKGDELFVSQVIYLSPKGNY